MKDFPSCLIACLEGFRSRAYQDSGGVWTIGFGHTKGISAQTPICTLDQAIEWLKEDQNELFQMVSGFPVLTQAAYLSFGINCGKGALHKILSGLDQIGNPVHTTDRHGNILSGLVTRRQLELSLIALSKG